MWARFSAGSSEAWPASNLSCHAKAVTSWGGLICQSWLGIVILSHTGVFRIPPLVVLYLIIQAGHWIRLPLPQWSCHSIHESCPLLLSGRRELIGWHFLGPTNLHDSLPTSSVVDVQAF